MRQPMSRPVTDMMAMGSSDLMTLATACPPSTAPLAMGSERKRSTAWFLRSLAMLMATPKAVNTMVWAMIPPIRNSR